MEVTKFKELCMAFGRAQNQFTAFKDDSHFFSKELVSELKTYFTIPDSQFSFFKISKEGKFEMVQSTVIDALILREDSIWQLGIGLTVCSAPETLPKELILIPLLIRRDLEGNFFLTYGDQEEEHAIERTGDKFNFTPFFDFLHGTIIKFYDEELAMFVGQDTRRTIGFGH